MNGTRRLGWIAGWIAAVGAGSAAAQEFRTNLRLGADAEYENNVLRSNRVRNGGDSSDVRVTPTLDVDIARPIGRNRVALGGTLGYDFYRRNSYLDRERIRLDAAADLGVGAFCQANLLGTLDFKQTDIGDLGERIGNTSRAQSVGGTIDCSRRTGLSPTLTARHTAVDNSDENRRLFDLRSDDLSAGIAYAKPSLGVARVFVSLRRIEQPFRPRSDGLTGNEARVTSAGLSVRRAVAPRIGFSADIAWMRTDTRGSGVPGYSGLGWTTSANWSATSRFRIAATLDRSVRGESSFGASYTVNTSNTVDLSYRIGQRTSVSLSAAQLKRRFQGETTSGLATPRGWDDTWSVSGSGDYSLFRNLGLRARVGYRRRNAGRTIYSYSSTSALVGARLRL